MYELSEWIFRPIAYHVTSNSADLWINSESIFTTTAINQTCIAFACLYERSSNTSGADVPLGTGAHQFGCAHPRQSGYQGDLPGGEQDQRLTATVTATAAANGCQQRPPTAHNTRTIRAN